MNLGLLLPPCAFSASDFVETSLSIGMTDTFGPMLKYLACSSGRCSGSASVAAVRLRYFLSSSPVTRAA